MNFQVLSTFNGHGISHDFARLLISGSPSSKFPWISRAVILGHVSVAINAAHFAETGTFGVHPCLWHLQRGFFLDTREPMWTMASANVDHLKWDVIYWKGSVRMSAVVPRQNAFGFRERQGPHRNRELDDGQRLWAPRVGPKALQCHNGIVGYSRCGNVSRWNLVKLLALVGMNAWNGAGIVWVHTRDIYTFDFGHMNHETHCHIIITSHWPTTEHGSTTNLIKSAELSRDPTWNSFGWNAVPPIQFLWPSRTNQIIRLSMDRTGMLLCVWLSSTTHDIS